jgi:type I restriction enzyme R subunit
MREMQKIINAERRDLFDVLACIAYDLPPVTRDERAARAKLVMSNQFNSRQQIFIDFVLSQYVEIGVKELDREKLPPLLRLKYNDAISDAISDLGKSEDIGNLFAGVQKYLYQEAPRPGFGPEAKPLSHGRTLRHNESSSSGHTCPDCLTSRAVGCIHGRAA